MWLCCPVPRVSASRRSRNFSRQGIDRLVLVRVVESRADVERLLAAVPGARATVCHLAANPSTVEDRIRRREAGLSTESPNGAAAKAGLNKSIHDAGCGIFLRILSAKAESAGRAVIAVDPRHTSQRCAECGHVAAGKTT
jgi:transposase